MFKRNNNHQRKSDTDLRGRRSLDAIRALAHARSSEQIPRHPPLPSHGPHAPNLDNHSSEIQTAEHILSSPIVHSTKGKHSGRFNLLRQRNASDPQLGMKAREQASSPPPPMPTAPPTPSIITTSPTNDVTVTSTGSTPTTPTSTMKRSGTMRLWKWRDEKGDTAQKSTVRQLSSEPSSHRSSMSTRRLRANNSKANSSLRHSRVTFDAPERPQTLTASNPEPPPYDDSGSTLPIPHPRLSESSRSTTSSGEHPIAYSTTTTTHTTTTTTFFRLPKRKKKDTPLFPLPPKTSELRASAEQSRDASGELTPEAPRRSMSSVQTPPGTPRRSSTHDDRPISQYLAASSLNIAGPGVPMLRTESARSTGSAPTSPQRKNTLRNRSHTMSSIGDAKGLVGKTALGSLFGRIRRDSGPPWGEASRGPSPQPALPVPGASASATQSRDLFIPERSDEDTPPAYLVKLFDAVSKSVVASLLARNDDPFHQAVLRAYMETFDFENDPMDMALRRLLMEVELPGEAQQIDRVLQAFADRYHDCNPFVYKDSDEAYFIAFSLIMLHTDFFNKNNKHKMQRADYVKNTSKRDDPNGGLSADILECFYSNITYTPFIRMEDEFDINGEKIVAHRPRHAKGLFHRTINAYDGRKLKEPIDPYLLIIDHQLDLLRCGLKDVIQFEDPYSYSGTVSRLDMGALHRAIFRSGVLQIVSARSRPDAFMSQATTDNPEGAPAGIIEIKVTKVGVLWRKELKRKKTRSPWQEWGAILTGSQLYFFKNVGWIKGLMHQYEQHHKNGSGTPVLFKPPLEEFKADAQISTDDAVALLDKSYKKHKNAFAFIRHGGIQEYFIADSESEMNDWLHNLNYAATFRTAGVRMRGVVGGNYEGQRTRAMRRLDSSNSDHNSLSSPISSSIQTPTGEVSIARGNIDVKLAAEITAARQGLIEKRIFDWEERLAEANSELQRHLRNGRHLAILCPIQPRAREQVMMAAATLAAKITWVRIDMWKLRCHRDILLLDMEEERKNARDLNKRITILNGSNTPSPIITASTPPPKSSPASLPSPAVPAPSTESTPTQATFSVATPSIGSEELTRVPTTRSNASRADTTTSVPTRGRTSITVSTSTAPRSSSKSSRIENLASPDSHRSSTPTISESSFGCQTDEIDDISPTPGDIIDDAKKDSKPDSTSKKDKRDKKDKDKDTKEGSRIRKSLQRTLRESTTSLAPHHHHHKRKHSSTAPDTAEAATSTPDGEKTEKEKEGEAGLPRGSGSFTVHGKKASVITFGSGWQDLPPPEELRLARAKARAEAEGTDGELSRTATAATAASERTVRDGESENFSGMVGLVRRGSSQSWRTGEEGGGGLSVPSLGGGSRRGSHVTDGELVDVPEHQIVELGGEDQGEGEKTPTQEDVKVVEKKEEEVKRPMTP